MMKIENILRTIRNNILFRIKEIKIFKLKPEFKNLFNKIYTRNDEKEWRYFSK